MARIGPAAALLIAFCFVGGSRSSQYFGKLIGKLSELHHGLSGEVYAVDGRTFYIKDFTYDGQGPAAYFYANTNKEADKSGFRLRDENGNGNPIRRYRKEGITLTLPEGNTLNNVKILYVWCEDFDVNFGDVKIPRNFDYPRPQKIAPLNGVHSVSSDNIVIVDAQTLLVPNFFYDGEAPDAKFWVGRGAKPSPQGIRVPDENGKEAPLKRYDGKTLVLTLPGDLTVFDIGHFGVWCEQFTVDFGHVIIPSNTLNAAPPSLRMLGVSPQKIHQHQQQQQQQQATANKVSRPLVGGHLQPTTFRPPSLFSIFSRRNSDQPTVFMNQQGEVFAQNQSKLNCEVLSDSSAFEVRWAVAGESIVIQLVAKLDDGEYMSFGPSGEEMDSVMIGGDVVVAWVDKKSLKGYAEDYYLADKSQCSGPTGSCPDVRLESDTNTIRLLNAATVNGYSIVTYQRPLRASDQYDRPILTNRSQAIIWATGPLNQRNEVSFHTSYLKKNAFIDFGRPARWNCPMPENDQPPMSPTVQVPSRHVPADQEDADEYEVPVEITTKRTNGRRRGGNHRGNARPQEDSYEDSENSASGKKEQAQAQTTRRRIVQKGVSSQGVPPPTPVKKRDAWEIPPIQCYEPEDGVFYAQMGPTGGKRGYPAITGHVGWGISWYINGLLIPEINVVRGKSYTFVVEGGLDPEVSAKYHPFYITDDPIGGYEYKTPEERKNIRIFAGVRTAKDGSAVPIGTGRLCHWTQTGELEADDFQSFGAYQRTLELKCDQGEPGVIHWTPDEDTPDTVYYQCYTHRHLGWKINVHDTCDDEEPAASELKPAILPAPSSLDEKLDIDLESSSSIQTETRVKPNDIIKEVEGDLESKSAFSEKKIEQTSPNHTPKSPTEPFPIQKNNFDPFYRGSRPQHALHSVSPHQVEALHHNHFNPENSTSVNKYKPSTITTEKLLSSPLQLTDNLAIASSHTNVPYLLPPVMRHPQHSNHKPAYPTHFNSPQMSNKRRPQNPYRNAAFPKHPYKTNKYVHLVHTKPKFPTNLSPMIHSPLPYFTKSSPIQSQMSYSVRTEVKNVEVSPQQPPTEREPDIQTAPSTSALDMSQTHLNQAYNTGFKPGSIKIESGFKPIITKELQDRIDEDELVIQDIGETGIVNVDRENEYEYKPIQAFEPMFVPSPTYKPLKEKRTKIYKRPAVTNKHNQYVKIILKRSKSLDDEEQVVEAAENVESYYLPPPNSPPLDVVREPSNIDIELPRVDSSLDSPPDVVVTYDGKRVSGQSLTARLSDRPSPLDHRLSKASAFLTARPQFGQFKGELPPLDMDFINKNAPQLQGRVGVLNRDLDTPLSNESGVPPGSTRLSRVQRYEGESRRKREAHHTPEHTAAEQGARNKTRDAGGACGQFFSARIHLCVIFFGLLMR